MKLIKEFFKFLFNLKYYFLYWNRFRGLTEEQKKYILGKKLQLKLGCKIDLDNPKTFNEKINWLKLNYKNPILTKCADKYAVREYVKEKIGEEYLIPLLGVWNSPDEIDFDKLPNQFVLKVNWGCGQNIIVKDKSKLNIEETKQKLRKWILPESNAYYSGFEWSYKDISPKIVAEEYLQQLDGDLYDYKFLTFNGKVKVILIVSDRFYNKYMNWYDKNFNLLPFNRPDRKNSSEIEINKELFDKMSALSEKLSGDLPFVRVDFYLVKDKIYFGEMTFYPSCGFGIFEPEEWDKNLGDLLDLTNFIKN